MTPDEFEVKDAPFTAREAYLYKQYNDGNWPAAIELIVGRAAQFVSRDWVMELTPYEFREVWHKVANAINTAAGRQNEEYDTKQAWSKWLADIDLDPTKGGN